MKSTLKKLKPEAVKLGVKTSAPKNCSAVTLELAKPGVKQVCVAGSFNNWQPEATPMRAEGKDRWKAKLEVQPGRHEYLFVADGQWLPDPNARESVQNPFGGKNSVLIVAA